MRLTALLAAFLAGLLVAIGLSGRAQVYIGAAVGYSKAEFPSSTYECDGCASHELNATGTVEQFFVGYQDGRVALELGGGSLSHYRSHNIRTGSDIQQEIDTSMVYLRGLAFTNPLDGWRAFASAGAARVSMRNHEFGRNDPSRDYVDQLNYDVRTRPLLGAGVEYSPNRNLSLRAEVTRITSVAVSRWSLSQDVNSVWLGLVGRF